MRDEAKKVWIGVDFSAEEAARRKAAGLAASAMFEELPPVEGARIVDDLHRRFFEVFRGAE